MTRVLGSMVASLRDQQGLNTFGGGPAIAQARRRMTCLLGKSRFIFSTLMGVAFLFAHATSEGADERIAIVSVTEPPAAVGIDAAALRQVAEDEIRTLDRSQVKRPVGVSLAVVGTTDSPASCVVNATVQDRKRGTIVGIAVGESSGPAGANSAALARAALRNAINRVPAVIAATK